MVGALLSSCCAAESSAWAASEVVSATELLLVCGGDVAVAGACGSLVLEVTAAAAAAVSRFPSPPFNSPPCACAARGARRDAPSDTQAGARRKRARVDPLNISSRLGWDWSIGGAEFAVGWPGCLFVGR